MSQSEATDQESAQTTAPESAVADGNSTSVGENWHRGVDDAINLSLHLGGAFACRNFAAAGEVSTSLMLALGCCVFSVVFSSFFSNVTRPGAQWLAFLIHAACIVLSLFLFAPNVMIDGLGAFGGFVPGWMAALFGSAMGSLAATGIGDASGD